MNKFLLIVATIITLSAKSQTSTYHPFPDSNAVWKEYRIMGGSPYADEWNGEKFIHGDTVIAGNSYHKIYESGLFMEWETIHWTLVNSYYYYDNYSGVIRQDTGRRVYTYDNHLHQDILLYDFTMQIGDTVPTSFIHAASSGDTIIVSNIDSIFDGSNYRKRIVLSNYPPIIEGIGSTFGLFAKIDFHFESQETLHCFMQNDSIKFTDSTIFACDIVSNIIENPRKLSSEINLFPNPTDRILYASIIGRSQFKTAKIFNSMTEEMDVSGVWIKDDEYIEFNVSSLPPGIYFLELSGEREREVKRFVKL